MSAGILLPDSSGVTRRVTKVPFSDLSGVQRSAKAGWLGCPSDGVNRKIFSSAVTWTYAFTNNHLGSNDSTGVDWETLWLSLDRHTDDLRYATVVFTFSEPVNLPAANAIKIVNYTQRDNTSAAIVEASSGSKTITSGFIGQPSYTKWFSPGEAISISSITVKISGRGISSSGWDGDNLATTLTLYPVDRPAFVLNNSGTSDQ